nr:MULTISPECIES: hypothetical protein [unclassified Streptomyces]
MSVRTHRTSVPLRLIGRNVRAMPHASELVVHDGRYQVARHERLIAKGGTRLEPGHYPEALVRKPGALPAATALDPARSAGRFTPVHDAWWEAAVKAHGERDGTRALIEVLLLGRHLPHEHLVTCLAAALRTGALTADAVAFGARRAADADTATATARAEQQAGMSRSGRIRVREHRQRSRILDHHQPPSVQSLTGPGSGRVRRSNSSSMRAINRPRSRRAP